MDDLAGALRPRYIDTPAKAGLYESLYLTAHHPTEPQALWLRHTVLKRPGAKPRAALWCTWFGGGGVRAGKVSSAVAVSSPDRPLQVGDHGWIGVDGVVGAIDLAELRASWDLKFQDPEPPLHHLPRPWMYTAPFPRTKSVSAAPMVRLSGSLEVDGQAVDIDGWPCSIGHNWGAEHAERWIWVHADAGTDEGHVWLDVVLGRVRLGPVTILGLTQTADGRLKLLAAEGESIPGPTFRIGNTNSRIRFSRGPAAFFDDWCAQGPTHHVALGIGHRVGTLTKVAHLLGLELTVVA